MKSSGWSLSSGYVTTRVGIPRRVVTFQRRRSSSKLALSMWNPGPVSLDAETAVDHQVQVSHPWNVDLRFNMEAGPPQQEPGQALNERLRLRDNRRHDPALPGVVPAIEPLTQ